MTFLENLEETFGKIEAEKLLSSLDLPPLHALILDEKKMKKEDFLSLFPLLKNHPIIPNAFLYEKEIYDFGKLPFYQAGLYSIQEPAAMLPGFYLPVSEGDHVLDLCAAPGGKSIELALRLNGSGVLLSNDLSYPRAKDLSSNIERMGLGNVVVSCSDFSKCHHRYQESFDSILLDAPCSGSAMFRKNELAKVDWSYEKVLRQQKIQKELIEYCYSMLAPNGYLLYSTCSFSKEENEDVIIPFLEGHLDLELVELEDHPSFYHSPSLKEAVYLLPHLFLGEGQFFCLLHKKGSKIPHPAKHLKEKKYEPFLRKYGLEDRSSEIFHGTLYSLSESFPVKGLNILRYGVPLLEVEDKKEEPSHHLSHYLDHRFSLPLSEKQMKDYLEGLSFPYEAEDGWYPVSYLGVNLGFAKIAKKILKNHYPKGLRSKG